MPEFRIAMLLGVLLLIAILYLAEVRLGSFTAMHDAEAGLTPSSHRAKKNSNRRFFGEVVPLQLSAVGLPVLINDAALGGLFLLTSLLLFSMRHHSHRREENL